MTAQGFRVLLIERSAERALALQQALAGAGHRVVAQSRSTRGLHDAVEHLRADLVIIDTEAADEDTLAQVETLSARAARPVIVFTDDADTTRIRRAVRNGVSSYVVNGFAPARIAPIVEVALARFEAEQALRAERDEAQRQLAQRKVIERAKGILMRKRGIGEAEAYHALRRIAMDRNLRMSEVAERLISMSDLLD